MACYEINNLSFTYPKQKTKCLDGICLRVEKGEFVTVCGKSGCGKTTLLRHLKPSVAPCGERSGEVLFEGNNTEMISLREESEKIGFVQQNPDNMLVTDKVWHELSFGLENLGVESHEIKLRVAEITAFFGLQHLFHKKVSELSGGQKQLLNLASILVMNSSVLILDEPTSQLDPIAAQDFLKTLKRVNSELGVTVIISEHRTEEVFAISDRIVLMESGRIVAAERAEKLGSILSHSKSEMLTMLPTAMRAYAGVQNNLRCPVTVSEGTAWLKEVTKDRELKPIERKLTGKPDKDAAILKDVFFRYEKSLPDVLSGVTMKIPKGEIYGIVGGNGFGKSTLLSVIGGTEKPQRGRVELCDGCKVGLVPQNPMTLFAEKTVKENLAKMMWDTELSEKEKTEKINAVVKDCEIGHILERHPYDISGGEQQRAAVAMILLREPDLILLDEPTKGMDAVFKRAFGQILKRLKNSRKTVVIVSHDIEFCAEYSDRCAMMFDGKIISENSTEGFFANNRFYTTAARRMAKEVITEAILVDEIIGALGGSIQQETHESDRTESLLTKENTRSVSCEKQELKPKRSFPKKNAIIWLITLIVIPLTAFAGTVYFGDRRYYLISILIIFEIMFPFFAVLEFGKPKVSELVTISVICAIAVGGRVAFAVFHQFKPMLAMIIIAGACMGCERGFLVGAISGFVSNFYFGQGPWTVWQMVAFGMCGFFAGVLFGNGVFPKNRWILSLYGGVAAIAIYGVIMNVSSVFMMQQELSMELAMAYMARGFPFDAIHAVATVLFLWIASPVMIEKIERVKLKYGIME
ncbi:MAG: ATP-binding cassette domain-containing protein [Clostridia bacterium]|nr:ATP-binding cassette domain-containing protein [Clostridia bacterium]